MMEKRFVAPVRVTPPPKAPDPIEKKMLEMLYRLPIIPKVLGSYVPLVKSGKLVFISGQLPIHDNNLGAYKGRLGKEITIEAGQRAAQQCTLNALAHFKAEFGGLDKLKQVIKITGYVSGMPGFSDQPKVINGASDLLVNIYGDAGRHARVAVGVMDLPMGACVEIDYIFEVK